MKLFRKIPKYAYIPTILIIVMQFLAYFGTQFINIHFEAYDFTITYIDDYVPFISFFIIFYILSYPWWYSSPLIVANTNEKRFFDWAISLLICMLISGLIFAFLPTTITRPVIENNNIFDSLTNIIYLNDNPDRPINLFPSFHCLFSWFCYMGVRGQDNIPKWYRISSLVFAILICLSTQFVKQHYIVDLVSAIILAEVMFYICTKYNIGNILRRITTKG